VNKFVVISAVAEILTLSVFFQRQIESISSILARWLSGDSTTGVVVYILQAMSLNFNGVLSVTRSMHFFKDFLVRDFRHIGDYFSLFCFFLFRIFSRQGLQTGALHRRANWTTCSRLLFERAVVRDRTPISRSLVPTVR